MHDSVRRRFLKYLAASPLFVGPGFGSSLLAQDGLIASPDFALDVFDFEAVARQRLPSAHFGFMATGVDDEATLRANREGFGRYQLRVRRLIDLRGMDMSVTPFGTTWDSPIVLSPVSSQRACHVDGEIASARKKTRRWPSKTASTASLPPTTVVGRKIAVAERSRASLKSSRARRAAFRCSSTAGSDVAPTGSRPSRSVRARSVSDGDLLCALCS